MPPPLLYYGAIGAAGLGARLIGGLGAAGAAERAGPLEKKPPPPPELLPPDDDLPPPLGIFIFVVDLIYYKNDQFDSL